ncbi:MAG: type IV pilus secretin PilQ [Smithellaceae bacterium]|nr:type IV pilus secretin PilQ [Smithellaceae bacterium]
MAKEHPRYSRIKYFLLMMVLVLSVSCGPAKKEVKDPFFERWETLATESKGHSPAPRAREIDIPEIKTPLDQAAKSLPALKITLKMRQAEIKAVLRSMARIAGVHLLINNDIKGDVSFDFKDIPWDHAFVAILRSQGLSHAWEGDIIRVMTVEEMERDLRIATTNEKRLAQQLGAKLVEPLQTVMINIDYAEAKLLKDNIQEFLSKDTAGKTRGSVRVDDHTNSLIIQASRDDLLKIVPIIERIDKPTYQIQIRANIVETTKEMARSLGLQWGGRYRTPVGTQELSLAPDIRLPGPPLASATAVGALGLVFGTIGGNILDLQLNALQNEGRVNILSSPSITTLDNQKAFTENGERVPFVTTDKEGNRTVSFQDAVLRLEITPHVIDGKNLKMKILVKKDEVDRARTVDGNPFIVKKLTETSLIVNDGETIVISGLTKHKKEDSDTGIPFLMKVPILEWFFKSQGRHNTMEEVLIFITPTILPPKPVALARPEPTREPK